MRTKLLVALIVCSAVVVSSQGTYSALLNVVMFKSNQLLDKFLIKYPIMKNSIEDLKLGLRQAYSYEATDDDLKDNYAYMFEINRRYATLSPDAVDKLSTFDALRLVSHLKKLNTILPAEPAVFRANIVANGGFGPMIGKACSPLIAILNIIS